MKKSLYVYLTQSDLSDGYILSEINLKRPNKAKLKKEINSKLAATGDRVNSIITTKLDVLELAKLVGKNILK
jgi:hypothetical protein